jgi:hypothetical protein
MSERKELLELVRRLSDHIKNYPELSSHKKELDNMAYDISLEVMAEEHDRQLREIEQSEMPKWMSKFYKN